MAMCPNLTDAVNEGNACSGFCCNHGFRFASQCQQLHMELQRHCSEAFPCYLLGGVNALPPCIAAYVSRVAVSLSVSSQQNGLSTCWYPKIPIRLILQCASRSLLFKALRFSLGSSQNCHHAYNTYSRHLQTSGVCNSLIAYSLVPRRPRPSFSTTYKGKVFKSLLNLLFSCKYESKTPPSMIFSISCRSQSGHSACQKVNINNIANVWMSMSMGRPSYMPCKLKVEYQPCSNRV